ncbi:MAG: aldehyde dehydrogenase family protein [Betaproteobacteria bacterium]|nr:aldehyde dehydrogenase family protein [Betaproteobacteria bacterium]
MTARFAEIGTVSLDPFIHGKHVSLGKVKAHPTFDPASGEVITEVPISGPLVVDQAVQSAKEGLKAWGKVLPAERSRVLSRTAAIIRREAPRLAIIESLDSGKPLREAQVDIESCARYFEYYAGIADKMQGDTIPLGPDYVSLTLHEPVGVTAHIIPWNFPMVTTSRGLGPALAAGCSAVVKPAEQTPLSTLALMDILTEAGLPPGVCNVVCGPGAITGDALASHPDVSHVTFTGSVKTGKAVMTAAARNVASVTLELGGKSPLTVLSDADIGASVEGILKGIFTNAGQVCSAGSRLVVERPVAEEVISKLLNRVAGFKFGRGLDNPDLGPLVSDVQLSKVAGMVKVARDRGVEVLSGGEVAKVSGLEGGWFYAPTILQVTDPGDAIAQEEVFGPVLIVQVVDSFDEAVAVANSTEYGLVAGIYTRDVSKAFRFAKAVDAGQVFINQFFAGGVETPFGGTRRSGFGREKGLEGLRSYFRVKTITARI